MTKPKTETLSEMRMGEMLSEIPKATPNNNPFHEIDSSVELVKPKSQVLAENGISQKSAERYQQMAAHPEIVEQAIAEARDPSIVIKTNFPKLAAFSLPKGKPSYPCRRVALIMLDISQGYIYHDAMPGIGRRFFVG